MVKLNSDASLARAKSMLRDLDKQLVELGLKRKQALLEGDNAADIKKLDVQIETARHAHATESDRVEALEQELAHEAERERIREREKRLKKFEEAVTSPEALGTRLQEAAVNLEREFRLTIEAREAARAMWPYGASSHMDVAAVSATGCALSAAAVAELLSYELFRIGKKLPSGVHGAPVPQSLPGPRAPSLNMLGQPEKIQPLSEKLRQASAFAVTTLRSGSSAPPVQLKQPTTAAAAPPAAASAVQPLTPPAAPATRPAPAPTYVQGTPAAQRMAELNQKLAALANDISPAGEKAYAAVVAEIAEHDAILRAQMAVADGSPKPVGAAA